MGNTITRFGITLTLVAVAIVWSTVLCFSGETALDPVTIERLTGAKGELNEKEGVFKVSMPRTDLDVHVAGVKMTPPLGLTSWAAFHKMENQTMVMGDMVMLEDQVNPVMSKALESGIEVTALHNHFFWDTPKVMFMHIDGMGDEGKLAEAVGNILAKIKEKAAAKGSYPKPRSSPTRRPWIPGSLRTS